MRSTGEGRPRRDELPTFDVEFRFDDPDDPRKVTLYLDDAEHRTTSWITVTVQHCVPLDEVA